MLLYLSAIMIWISYIINSSDADILALFTDKNGDNVSKTFEVFYHDLDKIYNLSNNFLLENGLLDENFYFAIKDELDKYKFQIDLINYGGSQQSIFIPSAFDAVKSIIFRISDLLMEESNEVLESRRIFFTGIDHSINIPNHFVDIRGLLFESIEKGQNFLHYQNRIPVDRQANMDVAWSTPTSLPPFIISEQTIVFYQNRGANTGGTTAMFTLFQRLQTLGYNVIMCNDSNAASTPCRAPIESWLVVTGEWCEGALEDYGEAASLFSGRGVQYHLGFHHRSDTCTGRVTMTDSHYLWTSFNDRGRGAYYWGCEMARPIKLALQNLLVSMSPFQPGQHPDLGADSDSETVMRNSVRKENLVVFDPDYTRDYPPRSLLQSAEGLSIPLPPGTQLLVAQGIPSELMPVTLQRAKVVVDLAFPGPERLAGEGVLMGAIPIISNRWNGVSAKDFPGLIRVDPNNATEIKEAIDFAITYYDDIIFGDHTEAFDNNQSTDDAAVAAASQGGVGLTAEDDIRIRSARIAAGVSEFFAYILSMWRRAHHTADVVIGSAHLHFILAATSLEEEYLANLQILGLLYVYPLARIDLCVTDEIWYIRHHYSFFTSLKEAGYVRSDPLDPFEHVKSSKPAGGQGFISIRSISDLSSKLILAHSFDTTTLRNSGAASRRPNPKTLRDFDLSPMWNPITIIINRYVVFSSPDPLLEILSRLPRRGYIRGNERSIDVADGTDVHQTPIDDFVWLAVSPFTPVARILPALDRLIASGSRRKASGRTRSISCSIAADDGNSNQGDRDACSSMGTPHVCDLLERSSVIPEHGVVSTLPDTLPWKQYEFFTTETIGKRNICLA